jgi:hypothetical protein
MGDLETIENSAGKPDRFDRGAWLVLGFALLILLLSTTQLVYRFFLPTDGWAFVAGPVESAPMYYENLVGVPSGLRLNDVVNAIEGVAVADLPLGETPAYWHAGNEVLYSIIRGEEQLEVRVPVVEWTLGSLLSYQTMNVRLPGLIGDILLIVVGFLAFFKRPGEPATRALLIFVAALGALVISTLLPDGFSITFDPIAAFTTLLFSYFLFGTLLAPALLSFTLVFPRPKPVVIRHPWLAYSPYLAGAFILIALITTGAWQPGWIGTLTMVILAIASLIHSALTMRDAVSRAQLMWALGGITVGLGLFLLNFPSAFGWVDDWAYQFAVVASLGPAVMGLGLAIAVLRYRLFDIDVIIRRTTAYAILTGMLALIYFGSVVLLQRLLTPFTGESTAAVVLSTLLIAALFMPLRRRIQDAIDRRFFRRKYDAEQTLAAFAATVRNETDLDALTAELVRVIQDTMEPEHVSVWLRPQIQAVQSVERVNPSGRSDQL